MVDLNDLAALLAAAPLSQDEVEALDRDSAAMIAARAGVSSLPPLDGAMWDREMHAASIRRVDPPYEPPSYYAPLILDPPATVTHHHTHFHAPVTNSAVNSGAGTINARWSFDAEVAATLVEQLRALIPELRLGADVEKEMRVDLETVEIQLSSGGPKTSIIQRCVESFLEIAENAAGSVAAQVAIDAIHRLAR